MKPLISMGGSSRKTLEINRLSDDIEYHTTVKQGYIHNEIKEIERILKSMSILSSDD